MLPERRAETRLRWYKSTCFAALALRRGPASVPTLAALLLMQCQCLIYYLFRCAYGSPLRATKQVVTEPYAGFVALTARLIYYLFRRAYGEAQPLSQH